ncbi:MAG: MMPL family transporter, partial [Chloroflexi bacterium]|nr:MMPL family transporter [Chloroflexota bacterium]
VVAFFLAGTIGDVTADTDNSSSELEYVVAQALVSERISGDAPAKEFVVVEFEKGTAENAGNKAFISSLAADLQALENVVGVTSYLDGVDGLLSSDETTALVMTTLSVTDDESADIIEPLLTVIQDADASDGFSVATVGQGSLESEFMALAEETLAKGEMIGVGFALVILLFVFGAAVAAGLPIMLAIVSIIVAVALSAVIGRVMDLDQFVVQIISMIGLAVGIDYALFIVKRYGEELANGRDKIDAITAAGNTAGRTVLVSGAAVMIALAGMLIVPDVGFRSFGLGAIVVVVAAVSAATTLLPAIISVLGHRVFWLRIPFVGRKIVVQTDQDQADSNKGGIWDKITDLVTARPVISVVVAGGALVAVTGAALTMNLGSSGISSLPEGNSSRHAYEVLNAEFDNGLITTDIVIDTQDATSTAVQSAITSLKQSLDSDPFYGETTTIVAPGNDLVIVSTVLQGNALGETAEDALARLRDRYIPAAFDGVADVYVAGNTAEVVDNVNMISKWLPIVFGLVLTSSFLLLLVVFRSIVVPIKAVIMNVLSVGAAYGLLVLVFQNGIGIDLLGFQRAEQIEYWLPMFLFSILFGLSMDYHVFLLSRIKEHYDLTGDNKASVAFGLRSTAGIITGAALIMVGVFGGFALGDMTMFQQMGFGLAAAVIIDATVVRTVLVPASMVLLGDKNWYFPSWLEWLPRLDVEGEEKAVEAPSVTPTPVLVPSGAAD